MTDPLLFCLLPFQRGIGFKHDGYAVSFEAAAILGLNGRHDFRAIPKQRQIVGRKSAID